MSSCPVESSEDARSKNPMPLLPGGSSAASFSISARKSASLSPSNAAQAAEIRSSQSVSSTDQPYITRTNECPVLIGVRATAQMACGLEGLMDETTLEAYF